MHLQLNLAQVSSLLTFTVGIVCSVSLARSIMPYSNHCIIIQSILTAPQILCALFSHLLSSTSLNPTGLFIVSIILPFQNVIQLDLYNM